ncbi:MAG: FAD-dependent oxidoreductase [Pseudomonadota bacterium]
MTHIVVVGAGQAGSSLVVKLRKEGFTGPITLIGAEPFPPYQRPPLSKAYLLGETERERLFLRPARYYADADIALKLGVPASDIDLAARTLMVGDETICYDKLAITTGLDARRLPAEQGGALGNVHIVRTLEQVDALKPRLRAAGHLLVIGGGYIGLEAAAVARKLGLKVTLLEMADRILRRVACRETSDYFRTLHTAHGVDILEGVGLGRLIGDRDVSGAEHDDGVLPDIDIAIVGIGLSPRCEIAEKAGLAMENGVCVDETGRTSDPSVWAAGDCAAISYRGTRIRLESVQNAIEQAETVALNMMGPQISYDPKPWFWSDQYDVKLQIAGLSHGHDRVIVRPGSSEGSQSNWCYQGDLLLSVDAMNDPRAYMIGKRLIECGASPAPDLVADPSTQLKSLLS